MFYNDYLHGHIGNITNTGSYKEISNQLLITKYERIFRQFLDRVGAKYGMDNTKYEKMTEQWFTLTNDNLASLYQREMEKVLSKSGNGQGDLIIFTGAKYTSTVLEGLNSVIPGFNANAGLMEGTQETKEFAQGALKELQNRISDWFTAVKRIYTDIEDYDKMTGSIPTSAQSATVSQIERIQQVTNVDLSSLKNQCIALESMSVSGKIDLSTWQSKKDVKNNLTTMTPQKIVSKIMGNLNHGGFVVESIGEAIGNSIGSRILKEENKVAKDWDTEFVSCRFVRKDERVQSSIPGRKGKLLLPDIEIEFYIDGEGNGSVKAILPISMKMRQGKKSTDENGRTLSSGSVGVPLGEIMQFFGQRQAYQYFEQLWGVVYTGTWKKDDKENNRRKEIKESEITSAASSSWRAFINDAKKYAALKSLLGSLKVYNMENNTIGNDVVLFVNINGKMMSSFQLLNKISYDDSFFDASLKSKWLSENNFSRLVPLGQRQERARIHRDKDENNNNDTQQHAIQRRIGYVKDQINKTYARKVLAQAYLQL